MSVGTADIHTAIATCWNDNGLDTKFKDLWNPAVEKSNFFVLNEK